MNDRLLSFPQNRAFKIMAVGDIHERDDYSENGKNKLLDYLTLLDLALEKEKIDLVVFMGDQAGCETKQQLDLIIKNSFAPVMDRKIPFAVILGNHDGENGLSRDEHKKYYKNLDGCLYQDEQSYKNDYGDYCINICDENSTPRVSLMFIDSGYGANFENSYYSTVSPEQNQWFLDTQEKIKEDTGKYLPTIIFQHIPVCEEYELLKETNIFSRFCDGVKGVNGTENKYFRPKRNEKTHFDGYLGEAPATPDVNSGQFDVWKTNGNVKAAFFGHDHMNDFTGYVGNILMCQCKTASFRVYGDGMNQGVRIIDVSKNGDVKTKMIYYRDLIGNSCRSLHGRIKWFHDRLNVKIDFVEKYILPVVAVGAVGLTAAKLLKKK